MIKLTKLNGEIFSLNEDLIEQISENPDTTIMLNNSRLYIVRESMDEVISKIKDYKRFVFEKAIIIERANFENIKGDKPFDEE